MAPGSFLAISHLTGDGRDSDTLAKITGAYHGGSAPLVPRSKNDITAFFDGFEIVPPGVVFAPFWRRANTRAPARGTRWFYAGIGRKPASRRGAAGSPRRAGDRDRTQ